MHRPLNRVSAILILTLFSIPARGQVIDAMESNGFVAPTDAKTQQPRGAAKLVPGQSGQAIEFSFADKCQGAFFMRRISAKEWDRAAGLSFWVKGDGSDRLGGFELIDGSDFGKRYAISFSIKQTDWQKITVPWRDVIPELSKTPFIDPAGAGGYKPSGLGNLWVGKWWYWRNGGACTMAIDQINLESTIDLPADPTVPAGDPLARTREKLRKGEPVRIVLMGDSLTDDAHNSNRQTNWPTIFKQKLAAASKSTVTVENTAIGGTTLRQNLVLMPRWTDSKPDLVTVFFGGNDYNEGMRGTAFKQTLAYTVDRIRRMTDGADVILMTTAPALKDGPWTQMEELAEAARAVAREKNTGLVDIAAAFHKTGDTNLEARKGLYHWDAVHLGPAGQERVAQSVMEAMIGP